MAQQRIFLGWDGPFLPRVARWLLDRHPTSLGWDLSHDLVVTSAGRAGRRLLELLIEAADDRLLVPPKIITLGELPEQLYTPDQPIADDLTCLLARMQALRQGPASLLKEVVHHPPAADDLTGWQMLARDLASMSQALAAQGISVDQVADRCAQAMDFPQHTRWQALAELEQQYQQALADAGWIDRHQARRAAIAQHRCTTTSNVILAAVIDLNQVARQMLQQVASQVTLLIQAPPPESPPPEFSQKHPPEPFALYDDWGGVVEQAWLDQPLELDQARMVMVDLPRDQATAALQAMEQAASIITPHATQASNSASWSADQITLGLTDESLAPTLERTLQLKSIPVRSAVGQPIQQTPPARMLQTLASFLASQRFDDLAALLRHPDVEDYLLRSIQASDPSQPAAAVADWLTLLDRYLSEHLQGQSVGTWLGDQDNIAALKSIHDAIIKLGPAGANTPQPIASWGPAIAQVLRHIYGHLDLSPHQPSDQSLIQTIQALARLLDEQASIHPDSPLSPKLTFSQAIQFTLGRLTDQRIVPPGGSAAVEMLGWLELPLDDAPVLIITSVNEGFLPENPRQDAFLTDAMRRTLGLMDHQRRLARDKAMLTAIVHSRPSVTLIAGRRSLEGDPLIPSRLLLSCSPDKLAPRLLSFYDSPGPGIPAIPSPACGGGREGATPRISSTTLDLGHGTLDLPSPATPATPGTPGQTSQFLLPRPTPPDSPISELPVTAFRSYLACPYRFYLRHVLKLRALEDHAVEMDGLSFGNLAHTVLQRWAKDGPVDSADARELADWFSGKLDQLMRRQYGSSPSAALQIQKILLQDRLTALAHWQAQQTQEGWKVCTQWVELSAQAQIQVDGQPFTLRGRIDRIDHHPQHGYRLLDYKTGDAGDSPEETHRSNKQWLDLQLPLYRQLATGLGIEGPMQLGYILLPKKLSEVGLSPATWDENELAQAMDLATEIIRKVRANIFWPPGQPIDDELSDLCLDLCLDRPERIRRAGLQSPGKSSGIPGIPGGQP